MRCPGHNDIPGIIFTDYGHIRWISLDPFNFFISFKNDKLLIVVVVLPLINYSLSKYRRVRRTAHVDVLLYILGQLGRQLGGLREHVETDTGYHVGGLGREGRASQALDHGWIFLVALDSVHVLHPICVALFHSP